MTPYGASGMSDLVLGTVAYNLLRKAPIPVLSFRPSESALTQAPKALLSRILVALDGSALSLKTVPMVLRMLGETRPEVCLLYVAHPGEGSAETAPAEHDALREGRQLFETHCWRRR